MALVDTAETVAGLMSEQGREHRPYLFCDTALGFV